MLAMLLSTKIRTCQKQEILGEKVFGGFVRESVLHDLGNDQWRNEHTRHYGSCAALRGTSSQVNGVSASWSTTLLPQLQLPGSYFDAILSLVRLSLRSRVAFLFFSPSIDPFLSWFRGETSLRGRKSRISEHFSLLRAP